MSKQGTKTACFRCGAQPKHEVMITSTGNPVVYYACDTHVGVLRKAVEQALSTKKPKGRPS